MSQSPQKLLIDDLQAYISQEITIISIAKRIYGDRPIMSSIVPTYNIISIADISINVFALLNIV